QLGQHCSSSLKALLSDLKGVEKAIKQLITDDPTLKALFELVTSIPGVGQVVATELILASDEFKAINDPKKLACHAGVAPFEHSSGSSVRDGPPHISLFPVDFIQKSTIFEYDLTRLASTLSSADSTFQRYSAAGCSG
ncbi:MAG: IS110 family transposase, partial [Cytophagaceae bacterium]